jgi:hypothetical protein
MKSLRDMGYDFAQAVADVVDNSVAAKATEIRIDIEFDGDDSWVRIADNGTGMRPDELREALRYGADRDYGEEDLGKFGLGLKTASLSQCRRLSVASRWNPGRAEIHAYAWDFEHIDETDRWEILPVRKTDRGPGFHELLRDHPGTVVLWERLDRILGYKHPYGEAARGRLAQMCRDVEQHLGMVLHRFISGEARTRLRVFVNDNEVRPWDPFCRSEARTNQWPSVYMKVDEEGASGTIRVEPFVLPHQSDFSSPATFKHAAGPNGWNQQQGLYVYRAGRMIQSGGWSRLRAPDEHTKLARVAISFPPALDEAFKVNVAKMRVQIPTSLREELAGLVQQLTRDARRVYDRKEKRAGAVTTSTTSNAAASGGTRSNGTGNGTAPDTRGSRSGSPTTATRTPDPQMLTFEDWSRATLGAATAREKPIVRSVLERLGPKLS